MNLALNILSAILLLAAVFVVTMNWAILFARLRSKASGRRRHISMTFLVGPILAMLGAMVSPEPRWLSFGFFLGVALTDPALLALPYFLFKPHDQNRRP
jgi:hypothetical protein